MPGVTGLRFLPRSLGLLFAVACASAPAAGTAESHGGSDVITRTELAHPSLIGKSVVEAIRHLRPRFLNERGGGGGRRGTGESAQVSIEGGEPGPVSDLARLEVGDIQEIRYLSTAEAGLRYGLTGRMRPVLLVTLRTR